MAKMTSGENIEYAIFKCVSQYNSFIEWLETWDISCDDWKTFIDAGRTAVDNNVQICGMGSDCDYNFCMRCGTKLARAKEG